MCMAVLNVGNYFETSIKIKKSLTSFAPYTSLFGYILNAKKICFFLGRTILPHCCPVIAISHFIFIVTPPIHATTVDANRHLNKAKQ